ncbi:hypothetical protein F0Q45_10260 [Mycobacterium simiae]|uniref:Uncharacterized protein n=1 Tax=Mycobacterium simiae TaxID=1784 RepID=A0A5B1BSI0_MYCSI|nr:hypothetical protein [Mycobacterium simiae]KAA1250313.1 hypothetical protein F0Q45_10260 [Mycobacterium simiae]
MAKTTDETSCSVCGVRLLRRWNRSGTDFTWLDEGGHNYGGDGGPAGVDNIWDYLDWLRIHDIGGYSLFLARVTLGAGILPWQHWHSPAPAPVVYEPGEVPPWCCGEPARLGRDGWLCRENKLHRPHSAGSAPRCGAPPSIPGDLGRFRATESSDRAGTASVERA